MTIEEKSPVTILDEAYTDAKEAKEPFIEDENIRKLISTVCRSSTKAGIRVILSCALTKTHSPTVDIRKPYTGIEGNHPDAFSGRAYDESYITGFINEHKLPCNSTTGYLTPSFRTKNEVITLDLDFGGRPKDMYEAVKHLLNYVHEETISSSSLLKEMIRCLIIIKGEKQQRLSSLLNEINPDLALTLSSEDIVHIIEMHLNSDNASRLPVLAIAAAYNAAEEYLKEKIVPLESHNAADISTKSSGDVEITLLGDDKVITSYEMKLKKVLISDIENALNKLAELKIIVDNYIFITTEDIDEDVLEYAKKQYLSTGGIEFMILNCVDFVRHFLHMFHRIRSKYLDKYQELVLSEPESSVNQNLKEIFLNLRIVAEQQYADT